MRGMTRNELIRLFSRILLGAVILIQIWLIVRFDGVQYADASEYVFLAEQKLQNGHVFYPYVEDLYTWYLHAPGYINYLMVLLRFGNGLVPVFILNALYINVILFSGKHIVRFLAPDRIAGDLFQIIFCAYCLIGMNGGVVQANTELLFGALLFGALVLLTCDSFAASIMAGIFFALSNWIRPIAFLFIPVAVWLIMKNTGRRTARIVLAGAFAAMTIFAIGITGRFFCGEFIFQSTITGTNLLIGNNPIADGNNTYDAFSEDGIGYVGDLDTDSWTYEDYQSFWKDRAVDWMIHNPQKVISLIPGKFLYQWAIDTYWCSAYGNNTNVTDTAEWYKSIYWKISNGNVEHVSVMEWATIVHEIIYVLCLLGFAVATVIRIKNHDFMRYWGLYSVLILGMGLNCIMAGCGRFHYPYMPVIIMITSITWDQYRVSNE